MSTQRDLTFRNFDEATADVDRLLQGHSTIGTWTLAQILNHLGVAIRLTSRPVAEPPPPPTPEQAAVRERFLQADRFPQGRTSPLPLGDAAGLDVQVEADKLRKAIAHFLEAKGPFPAHPFLGPLTHDQWVRFHLLHIAHHLGFALPSA